MIRVLVIAACALVVGGCSTLQSQSRVDPQTIATYDKFSANKSTCIAGKVEADQRTGAIDLDCLMFTDANNHRVLAYAAAQTDRVSRNRLTAILLKQSDDVCTVEMGRLTANEAMTNAGLSIATSALATAGSIVTGDLAKSILAGGSSLSNASRDHVNAEVYRNTLSTAVSKAIFNERDRLRGLISGRSADSTDDYTIDEAVMDVNRYHQSCSFFRGLGLVIQAVERTRTTFSDNHRTMTNAINELDARVGQLDDQIDRLKADDSRLTDLKAERKTLADKAAALRGKRSDLISTQAASGSADSDTSE